MCEARYKEDADSPLFWMQEEDASRYWAAQDGATRAGQLEELRKLLKERLTKTQAEVLRDVAWGRCDLREWMDLLRSGLSKERYFMETASQFADSLPVIASDPVQGYWLDFDSPGPYDHRFGGGCTLQAPHCIHCEKPLLHLLSFDTRDERLHLEGFAPAHLPLLFCWTCEPADDDELYAEQRGSGGLPFVPALPALPGGGSVSDLRLAGENLAGPGS